MTQKRKNVFDGATFLWLTGKAAEEPYASCCPVTNTNFCVVFFFQQRRGLDDKELLPYFPYRDDGEQILKAIENLVKEYVDL